MKASDFNTANYLNAESAATLAGQSLRIYDVSAETIREVRKLTIGFEGIERRLVVNKSNREIMTDAYGDETDGWIGKSVRLVIIKVLFKGTRTPSISIEPVASADQEPLPEGKKARK